MARQPRSGEYRGGDEHTNAPGTDWVARHDDPENAKRSKGESQDETSTTVIVGKGPVKAKVKAQAVLGALIETRSATTACWPPYPKMTAIASSNRQGWLTVQHDIY